MKKKSSAKKITISFDPPVRWTSRNFGWSNYKSLLRTDAERFKGSPLTGVFLSATATPNS